MQFEVIHFGKIIDIVTFADNMTEGEVYRSLVDHDGFDEDIIVMAQANLIKVTNIVWDFDEEDGEPTHLKNKMVLDIEEVRFAGDIDYAITDATGFYVSSFKWEYVQ